MPPPYYTDDRVTVHHGDALDILRTLPDCSVDSVVTDPPYGLEFMGKDWDRFAPQRDPRTAGRVGKGSQTNGGGFGEYAPSFGMQKPMTWRCDLCGKRDQFRHHSTRVPGCQGTWIREPIYEGAPHSMLAFQAWCTEWTAECLRVLKPGGHLLAFGGTRTWHRLACAIEDAGFEIRDTVASLGGGDSAGLLWMHGQGFPKSKNLDGDWAGFGTALKPAFEPIVVARKPLAGTVAANVVAWGTGALNIAATRVGMSAADAERLAEWHGKYGSRGYAAGSILGNGSGLAGATGDKTISAPHAAGRWPSNVVLTHSPTCTEDACEPGCPVAELDGQSGTLKSGALDRSRIKAPNKTYGARPADLVGTYEPNQGGASRFFPIFKYQAKAPSRERPKVDGVAHPTCKPLALMRWLIRLVTPPGGVVLDPFAGSGTTAEAAILEGFRCVTIEREAEYLPLILARIQRQEPVEAPPARPEQLALLDDDPAA